MSNKRTSDCRPANPFPACRNLELIFDDGGDYWICNVCGDRFKDFSPPVEDFSLPDLAPA
jgi:hypothetical protein